VWSAKEATLCGVKRSWEIIADNPSKAGWSWGCVSAIDSSGRTNWIADAHREQSQIAEIRPYHEFKIRSADRRPIARRGHGGDLAAADSGGGLICF